MLTQLINHKKELKTINKKQGNKIQMTSGEI